MYTVTIEFRYNTIEEEERRHYTKVNTIGTFSALNEAINAGNETLIKLEKRFDLNENYNIKRRLNTKTLSIGNIGYIKTPFVFFLNVTKLNQEDIDIEINNILESIEK